MSINVTVRGNPISIKRGKMVTYDSDSEFKQRRRIRLQQVREQDKEIAADIRNRVRREKEKQLTKAEKKGEQDLKRWKTRKLLALQQQYQDSLKEVGSAHTNAALEPDDNEILQEEAKQHQIEADIRQQIAANKAKKEEKEKKVELQKSLELKRRIRRLEDERAAMVTKLNQKQKKKRGKKIDDSDSESEIYISDEENISSNIIKDETPKYSKGKHKININVSSPEYLSDSSAATSKSKRSPTPSPKKSDKIIKTDSTKSTTQKYHKITKVSDRIKQRKSAGSSSEKKRKYKLQVDTYELVDIPSESNLQPNLPYIPTTTVIPEPVPDKIDKPVVQKINKDSIRVNPPSDRSELTEIKELADIRDKIAHDRGVRAMEKEKLQRDSKQLMDELPVLLKLERLSQMKKHNPTFHMPEDRLEELERRKQNKIENIFEKYYHKSKALETPLVTIPPVQRPLPNEELRIPFQALDVTDESNPQLNVGEWITEDGPPGPCAREEDKEKALIDLLQRVNKQRELLLQEVSTLPPNSNLQKIIEEDEIVKLIRPQKNVPKIKFQKSVATSPIPKKSKKRVTAPTTSSDSSAEMKEKKKQKKKQTHKKQKIVSTNGTQTSPSSENLKRSDFVCSCKSTTVNDCECDKKVKKNNICCTCGQRKKEVKYPQETHKCQCGEYLKEDTDDTNKVCEIIIKASKQANVAVCKDDKPARKKLVLNVSKPYNINIRPTTGNDVSSSTTYMSLPEKAQQKTTKIRTRQEYKDLLHSKPKQSNIDTTDACPCPTTSEDKKEITPSLLRYIKKLLCMSRQSIDQLTVSSVSDVSTPGRSVIDVAENISNPIVQLQNVMQYYNLSLNDIQKYLSDTATEEALRPKEAPQKSQPCSPSKSPRNYEEAAELVKDTYNLQPADMQEIPYANIVSKYKLLTNTCCERINQLTKMIDNVRLEKERLLSPDVSDKYETSLTSYLELPNMTNDSRRSNGIKSSSSTSSSMSQEAVDKYLLAINEKVPSPTSKKKRRTSPKKKDSPKSQHKRKSPTSSPKKQTVESASASPTPSSSEKYPHFVPNSSDSAEEGIPKYTDSKAQTMDFLNSPMKQFLLNSKTKPPPALLQNATRFNLNIDMTPHELSTIAEMDTVSEAIAGKSPPKEPYLPCMGVCSRSQDEADEAPKKSSLKKSSRICDPPATCQLETQDQNSEKSTSSPEDMETVLRNIGLSWAITTLKKTKEALALSSSSSSLEASFRKRVSFQDSTTNSSSSEIRDAISKVLRKKISSDSPRLSPYLQELQDLSEIKDPTVFPRDGSQHRTSTPVQNSKSPDSKKDLFLGDSDLSSVKMYSDELFLSIPNVSLDTNKSLSKSKE